MYMINDVDETKISDEAADDETLQMFQDAVIAESPNGPVQEVRGES